MAPEAVVSFFRGAIEGYWTFTKVKWPNEQQFDANSQPYLELAFPIDNETLASMGSPGSNLLPQYGAAIIQIYTPIGSGLNPITAPWCSRGDALISLLRPKIFANGFGETHSVDSDESIEDAPYFVRSIAIPYTFYKFG